MLSIFHWTRANPTLAGYTTTVSAFGSRFGAEVKISSSTEASRSFGDWEDVIFALEYQAIRITHFSNKLPRIDMDIKKDDFAFF